jgi:hypothetical protein
MSRTLLIAATAAIATSLLAIAPASAAPLSPLSLPGVTGGEGLAQTVAYGRCRAWRHECARRWGWGGPRFRRCLAIHAC